MDGMADFFLLGFSPYLTMLGCIFVGNYRSMHAEFHSIESFE